MSDYAKFESLFKEMFYYVFNKVQKKKKLLVIEDTTNSKFVKKYYKLYRAKMMKFINQAWEQRIKGNNSKLGAVLINEAILVFVPSNEGLKDRIESFSKSDLYLKNEIFNMIDYFLCHKDDKSERKRIKRIKLNFPISEYFETEL